MNLYLSLFVKKLNKGHRDKFEIKVQKISRPGSRSPDKAEFGLYTLLYSSGRLPSWFY